jgi:hypothetical protein
MVCFGVFSILLGSICKFPNDSDARTNRGLCVVDLYAYSSIFFDSTQKDVSWICDDPSSGFYVV